MLVLTETLATWGIDEIGLVLRFLWTKPLHIQALRKTAKPLVRSLCSSEHFNVVNTLWSTNGKNQTTEKSYQRGSDKMSHQVLN